MPNTRKCVKQKAERENWRSRPRTGRGGGLEYQVPDHYLTPEFLAAARDKFPERFPAPLSNGGVTGENKTVNLADLNPEPSPNILTLEDTKQPEPVAVIDYKPIPIPRESTQAQIWARQEIVKIWREYLETQKSLGVGEIESTGTFCRQVADGHFPIPDWVREGLLSKNGKIKISRAILFIWKNKTASEIAPKYKGRDSFFDSRPEYRQVVDALCQEFGAVATRIDHAFASGLIQREFGLTEQPTLSQIRTYVENLKKSNKQVARSWATGDKSILLSAQGSYSRGLQPNEKWEIDSTKMDVWLLSPHGETMSRWSLVACIDVATRRAKTLICPSSKGEAITLLSSGCIETWGLPTVIKTDNGKDYIGREVAGFFRSLGIEQKLCTPKQPWEKPHVERLMKLFQHSQEWELLPWNTGHNVAQQQAKRAKKEHDLILGWTADRFQGWLDAWCEAYHNQIHSELGCTPNEMLAAFRADGWVGLKPRKLKENLEFALLKEELVTVGKKGIRFNNRFYIAPEFQGLVGEKLAIRIDQDNPNQILVYDSLDLTTAKLICVAVWEYALTAEEQARIATAKPLVDQALAEHNQAVKQKRKAISRSLQKNPEQLLPERGGVAALQAFQTIDLPTQNLVDQLSQAASIPSRSEEKLVAIEKHRQELNDLDRARAAKPKLDLDQVVKDCVKAWDSGQPIPTELAEHLIYYVLQPTGWGALTAIAEFPTAKAIRRWAEEQLRKKAAV